MNTPKLIKQAKKLLDADAEKRFEKQKNIKEIMRKLKKKERTLKEKLKKEKDKKLCSAIKNDLLVIFAQRKKGVAALKKIAVMESKNKK